MNHDYSPFPLTTGTDNLSKFMVRVSGATLKLDGELRNMIKNGELMKEYIGMPPSLSVIVTGTKNGKRTKVAIANNKVPFGGMAGATSVPLTLAVEMIINGEITKKGVFPPEEAIPDPIDFFKRYAKHCGENLTGNDVLLVKEVELKKKNFL
ncbi:MAG: saccharopine dehydrogenase C-terminal domain-containing protein [Promethearchaeota archaeon]